METDSGTSSTFLPSTVCSSTSTLTTQTPAVTTTPTNADFEEPLQARFLVLERKLWELEVNAERDVGSSIDVGELDNMQDMQRGASEVRSVEDTEVDREDESVIETVIEWAYERDGDKEDDEEEVRDNDNGHEDNYRNDHDRDNKNNNDRDNQNDKGDRKEILILR